MSAKLRSASCQELQRFISSANQQRRSISLFHLLLRKTVIFPVGGGWKRQKDMRKKTDGRASPPVPYPPPPLPAARARPAVLDDTLLYFLPVPVFYLLLKRAPSLFYFPKKTAVF